MTRYPLGFARSLSALDFLLGKPKEIVVVGDQSAADTQALLRVVFEPFLPNKVVAGHRRRSRSREHPAPRSPRARDGKPTAYVCEHYVCQAPTTDPEELRAQLT